MARLSHKWHEMISQSRNGASGKSVLDSSFPVMPWITHALDPKLEALFLRVGTRRVLPTDALLFEVGEPIDQLVFVCQGVTARSMGNVDERAIGLATPGRIAAGNLNFFSQRHAIGRYFCLTESELCYCPRKLLLDVLKTDVELFSSYVAQLECAALSDRMSFACLALCDSVLRLKAFFASWAANYGTPVSRGGRACIEMPVPMTLAVQSKIVNSSLNWVDRIIHSWRDEGLWIRKGERVAVDVALLDEAWIWMRSLEEANERYQYPGHLHELFKRRSSTKKSVTQSCAADQNPQ